MVYLSLSVSTSQCPPVACSHFYPFILYSPNPLHSFILWSYLHVAFFFWHLHSSSPSSLATRREPLESPVRNSSKLTRKSRPSLRFPPHPLFVSTSRAASTMSNGMYTIAPGSASASATSTDSSTALYSFLDRLSSSMVGRLYEAPASCLSIFR